MSALMNDAALAMTLFAVALIVLVLCLSYQLRRMQQSLSQEINHGQRLQRALSELQREHEFFVYVTSHDLQEPIRAVEGFSQLIVRRHRSDLSTEAQGFIDFVRQGAAQMRKMIFALRDYSRACTAELRPHEVDMNHLLTQIEDSFKSDKDVRHLQLPDDLESLPAIFADEKQVRLVFMHLLDNAVSNADPKVPLEIKIDARPMNDQYHFTISDNGNGIPPSELENVFEPFRQIRKNPESGAGMGLTISRRILTRLGGRIWVESGQGRGARIHFTLPLSSIELRTA